VLAAVALEPSAPVQAAAAETIELPPYKGDLKDDYYPADARLHFRQGRALVEFAVDARGVPTDVVVVNSEPERSFQESARRLVKNLRFEVPAGWERGAAAAHRFRMGVRFQVIQCLNFSRCESQSRNPPADYDAASRTYVVSAQQRVLTFASKQTEAPAASNAPSPAPASAAPSAPSPAPPPRPRASPSATPEEPIYPPG
jgi:TonB family protein